MGRRGAGTIVLLDGFFSRLAWKITARELLNMDARAAARKGVAARREMPR